jgi:hypothetical protein
MKDQIVKWFTNTLGIEGLDIDCCFRLGKKETERNNQRPVKVTFGRQSDRDHVWRNKKKLKGTRFFIKEDLPRDIEKEVSKLNMIFTAARAKGYQCSMVRNKLYVNGQAYTYDTLHKLPEPLQPSSISSKTTPNEIYFWGRDCILSNMYECPIMVDNTKYNCVEQLYASEKARLFKDKIAEGKIMSEKDPIGQKRTPIKGFNSKEWEVVAEDIMHKCILTKFQQNEELGKFLVSTYPKEILEASPHDSIWGLGMGIFNSELQNQKKWGKNLTGKILMNVRNKLMVN